MAEGSSSLRRELISFDVLRLFHLRVSYLEKISPHVSASRGFLFDEFRGCIRISFEEMRDFAFDFGMMKNFFLWGLFASRFLEDGGARCNKRQSVFFIFIPRINGR